MMVCPAKDEGKSDKSGQPVFQRMACETRKYPRQKPKRPGDVESKRREPSEHYCGSTKERKLDSTVHAQTHRHCPNCHIQTMNQVTRPVDANNARLGRCWTAGVLEE